MHIESDIIRETKGEYAYRLACPNIDEIFSYSVDVESDRIRKFLLEAAYSEHRSVREEGRDPVGSTLLSKEEHLGRGGGML